MLALGSIFQRQAKVDDAIRHVEQAIPFYEKAGYRREALQALALLARGKSQKGDYEAARRAFEEQIKVAQQLGDMSQVQGSKQDIAFTFLNQGRFPDALKHLDESCAIAKSLRDEKNTGLCLINRANALWQLGRYDEAQNALSEASPAALHPKAARNLTAGFHLFTARLALSQRRLDDAKAGSEQALQLAGTDLKGIGTEAAYTLCLANSLSGATAEGRRHCEDALERAEGAANPSLKAHALLSLAQALLITRHHAGALKFSIEAQEIFSRLGNHDSEWVALQIAARSTRGKRDGSAENYATRAQTILAGLEQLWGSDNYKAYLSRPDIQSHRMQLHEFLAQKP